MTGRGATTWSDVRARARAEGRPLRVAHMCARDLVPPGNTLGGMAAAAEARADVVEFDVLPAADGELRLAHDPGDLATRTAAGATPPTMEEALDRLCEPDLAHLGIDLDVKVAGDEPRIAAAIRERGLVGRTVVSTQERSTLAGLHRVAPEIALGWSVPKVRRDWFANPFVKVPAVGVVLWSRQTYPQLLAPWLAVGGRAIMAHWALVSPRFARRVLRRGELWVWTVDDPDRVRALAAMGVTAIISNDPRILPGA